MSFPSKFDEKKYIKEMDEMSIDYERDFIRRNLRLVCEKCLIKSEL